MYHQHFRLSGAPFQFTPAPDALYLSKTHREGLAALEWSLLHEPTGFTLLVGDSGIGKTTLVCSILARCYANVRSAYVTNPKLSFDQMLQVILSQFLRASGSQTRLQMTESFAQLLDDLTQGERLVIIIDEAQELADETLDEFRLLSNVDTAAERRLQIIFVGQPELLDRLASPRMDSLNQRIGARVMLKPLPSSEVREYIDCRLRTKGGVAKKIFAPAALDHLVQHSRGIPRRTNVLCHNSMLLGFAAGRAKVSVAMARAAVNEFENLGGKSVSRDRSARAPRLEHSARAALAVAALVLVALGVLYVWSSERWFAVDRTSRHATLSGEAVRPTTVAPAQMAREILSGSLLPALVRMASSRYSLAGAQS
jgi:general secretion pathway protein A